MFFYQDVVSGRPVRKTPLVFCSFFGASPLLHGHKQQHRDEERSGSSEQSPHTAPELHDLLLSGGDPEVECLTDKPPKIGVEGRWDCLMFGVFNSTKNI